MEELSKYIEELSSFFIKKGYYFILPEDPIKKPNSSHINNGFCGMFANYLINKYPEAVYMSVKINGIPHDFIKYKNKYYDSENPYGIIDYKNFNVFK